MADYTIPRANAPIAGQDAPTIQWYNFLRYLDSRTSSAAGDVQAEITTIAVKLGSPDGTVDNIPTLGNVSSVQGKQSIASSGVGVVQLNLVNDADSVAPVYYYGTDSTGAKGWQLLFDAFADTANIAATDTLGIVSFDLTDVTVASGGTLQKLTFDAKGRLSEQSAATTDDLTEGSTNLYYTDARAGLAAVTLSASAPLDGSELVAVAQSGSPVQTTTKDVANLAFGSSTTSATAGAATALPLAPTGYVDVIIGGSPMKIPYYAP